MIDVNRPTVCENKVTILIVFEEKEHDFFRGVGEGEGKRGYHLCFLLWEHDFFGFDSFNYFEGNF